MIRNVRLKGTKVEKKTNMGCFCSREKRDDNNLVHGIKFEDGDVSATTTCDGTHDTTGHHQHHGSHHTTGHHHGSHHITGHHHHHHASHHTTGHHHHHAIHHTTGHHHGGGGF
ncbi:hypothetical protein GmHk_07G019361 [Glycine max]|nr:hypothetical protein GmHk_07G019361 [Glycine max]